MTMFYRTKPLNLCDLNLFLMLSKHGWYLLLKETSLFFYCKVNKPVVCSRGRHYTPFQSCYQFKYPWKDNLIQRKSQVLFLTREKSEAKSTADDKTWRKSHDWYTDFIGYLPIVSGGFKWVVTKINTLLLQALFIP